jgi:hypothetical protein
LYCVILKKELDIVASFVSFLFSIISFFILSYRFISLPCLMPSLLYFPLFSLFIILFFLFSFSFSCLFDLFHFLCIFSFFLLFYLIIFIVPLSYVLFSFVFSSHRFFFLYHFMVTPFSHFSFISNLFFLIFY